MAKMANLGTASRFALLKIDDDDSDEENGPLSGLQNKKPTQGKGRKFVPMGASANASTSQKNKKKPVKKTKVCVLNFLGFAFGACVCKREFLRTNHPGQKGIFHKSL